MSSVLSKHWLYDQAQLVMAYTDAYRLTGDEFFADVARGTLCWGGSRIDGRATAYVCEDFICQLPTADPEQVRRLLRDDFNSAAERLP